MITRANWWRLVAVAILLAGSVTLLGFWTAREAPVVVRQRITALALGCPSPPLRLLLMADLHVSPATMPPGRFAALVRSANGMRPDIVLLAGDFVGEPTPPSPQGIAAALAPLAALRARDGIVAVLGNHDWDDGAAVISEALSRAHVTVLHNDVLLTRRAAILGIEEVSSGNANPKLVEERYARDIVLAHQVPPLTLWMAHNPIMFDRVGSTGDLMLAGHTHGGQVFPSLTIPLLRGLARLLPERSGIGWSSGRFVRGFYQEGARRMIVTSGIGTSRTPIRLGVPPEIVVIDLVGCPPRHAAT